VAKVIQDRVQPLVWEILTFRNLLEAESLAIYVVGCPGCWLRAVMLLNFMRERTGSRLIHNTVCLVRISMDFSVLTGNFY